MRRHASPKRPIVALALRRFPRRHLVMASCAAVLSLGALLLLPSDGVQAKRHTLDIPLELQLDAAADPLPVTETLAEPLAPAASPSDADLAAATDSGADATDWDGGNWQELEVRPGDNLSRLFQRAGLPAREVHAVVHSSPEARQLARLLPGQTLAFLRDDNGQLLALRHQRDRLRATVYSRTESGYAAEQIEREPEVRQRFAYGTIDSSLYLAGRSAGLPDAMVMALANVFDGVIDFVFDIRSGDRFEVLFEERYLDGESIGSGSILAARFINRGRTHKAFRYVDSEGDAGYYSSEGVSMRKQFLRAPLDYNRVSSNFNMQRMHPIFNTVRPHRGVDYAAPTGTPVYAAGDGRVVESGYNRANGNYIVIAHGQQYTTKYLHLHRRNVKVGDRVRQRQLIGTVGATGYATGPHLHYEFLVNGVHRNPRTVLDQLPQAKSISEDEIARFNERILPLRTQFATHAERVLASARGTEEDSG